jgi:putative CocE/NonD family hydrolase
MRDGVLLRCDIYRLNTRERMPVLLQRTPYNKAASTSVNVPLDCIRAAFAGYCVIVQDVRGRYSSAGNFAPFEQELNDGYDTVQWAASEAWSNGQVGMFGTSYSGATQWLAAGSDAPVHAITPFLTAADWHDGWLWDGEAFRLGFVLFWTLRSLAWGEALRRKSGLDAVTAAIDRASELYLGLDGATEQLIDDLAPYYRKWSARRQSADWDRLSPRSLDACSSVPSLNAGGWYDIFLAGTIENYRRTRDKGMPSNLIVGPWAHGNYTGTYPERSYGHNSGVDTFDLGGIQLRWFDRWLKGGIDDASDPPVRIFVMGPNMWRNEEDWPPPNSSLEGLYLRSGGILSPIGPHSEIPDQYEHVWGNPVPTMGGATYLPGLLVAANAGPRDVRTISTRTDLLHYQTDPLSQSLELAGSVRLELHAASTAPAMHFSATLLDIYPGGRSEILLSGIATLRKGPSEEPRAIEPQSVSISLGHTAYVFDRSHRLGLAIASSSFPKWAQIETNGLDVARNSVFHDAGRPSRLLFSVRPRGN